jgi:hypothetical protein
MRCGEMVITAIREEMMLAGGIALPFDSVAQA